MNEKVIVLTKMKNRKYHTVGTVPKSRKTENTTLSEQFQNLIEKYHTVGTVPKSNWKINTLINIYMPADFHGLVQALQ